MGNKCYSDTNTVCLEKISPQGWYVAETKNICSFSQVETTHLGLVDTRLVPRAVLFAIRFASSFLSPLCLCSFQSFIGLHCGLLLGSFAALIDSFHCSRTTMSYILSRGTKGRPSPPPPSRRPTTASTLPRSSARIHIFTSHRVVRTVGVAGGQVQIQKPREQQQQQNQVVEERVKQTKSHEKGTSEC
jgi:hypothetical protein